MSRRRPICCCRESTAAIRPSDVSIDGCTQAPKYEPRDGGVGAFFGLTVVVGAGRGAAVRDAAPAGPAAAGALPNGLLIMTNAAMTTATVTAAASHAIACDREEVMTIHPLAAYP